MPLQFESISHGLIAFGFFNIESDLLLLENNFIFADAFCAYVKTLAENAPEKEIDTQWTVWRITSRQDMGDLMGAMHGMHYSGFFGELYRKYPFPSSRADFKQKPDGWKTQAEVKEIIAKYGRPVSIAFRVDAANNRVFIGDYAFTHAVFKDLIRYVWEGGYPKWKHGIRPEYVMKMVESIKRKPLPLFSDLEIG